MSYKVQSFVSLDKKLKNSGTVRWHSKVSQQWDVQVCRCKAWAHTYIMLGMCHLPMPCNAMAASP